MYHNDLWLAVMNDSTICNVITSVIKAGDMRCQSPKNRLNITRSSACVARTSHVYGGATNRVKRMLMKMAAFLNIVTHNVLDK